MWRSMFRSLAFKWTVTLLLTSLIGVVLAGMLAYRTTITEFDRLLADQAESRLIANAIAYYRANGTWEGVAGWVYDAADSGPADSIARRPPPFILADASGVIVNGHGDFRVGDSLTPDMLAAGTPILMDGERIGTALLVQPPELDPREQRYVDSTNRALLIGAAGASLTALIVGLLLSRQFLQPLSDLTRAIHAMRRGELDQRVEIRTRDELGVLAQTFNDMSADLARANQLRRQMTADIAHDLRTPLTVIGGYLEALSDGTLQPTPQRLHTMREEVTLLQRLVEDLRTLSLADAGELRLMRAPVAPRELLDRVAEAFRESAAAGDITLTVECDPALPAVMIDTERMVQVLGNLVTNALRHTPARGTITLGAQSTPAGVALSVRDTGSGIAPDDLPKVFDRLYRASPSRQTDSGESGLGLAIARSIVEAQGGTISASSRLGEGTTMTILIAPEKQQRSAHSSLFTQDANRHSE